MNTKVTFVKQIAPILGIRLSKTISNRILVSVPVFYEKKNYPDFSVQESIQFGSCLALFCITHYDQHYQTSTFYGIKYQ